MALYLLSQAILPRYMAVFFIIITSFFGEGCVMYLNGVCELGASKIYKNNVWAKTLGERLI